MLQTATLVTIIATSAFMRSEVSGQELELSQNILVVSHPEQYNVTCKAIAVRPSILEWTKGGEQISNKSDSKVYQRQDNLESILFLQNLSYEDEGNYSCKLRQETAVDASTTASVTVLSKPIIEEIKILSCNGTTSIKFRPHKNAEGITHRVTAVREGVRIEKISSENRVENHEETLDLIPSVEYNIKVSPCINEKCSLKYTATQPFITSPTDFEPSDVTMTRNNRFYIVQWKLPDEEKRKFLNFIRVTVTSSLFVASVRVNDSRRQEVKSMEIHAPNTSYSAQLQHNRNYSAMVQASACSQRSSEIPALGEFSTDFSVPTSIPSPIIGDAKEELQKREVLLQIPDESNGPIKCLFVIAARREDGQIPKMFTNKTLKKLNKSIISHHDITAGKAYIAFALDLESLNSSSRNLNFTMGEIDDMSTCTLNKAPYTGQHWRLTIYKHYSLYAVFLVVTKEGEFLFATSDMTTFQNDPDFGSSGSEHIEAIIGGLVAAIVIVLVAVRCYKRQKKISSINRRKSTIDYSATETVTGYSTVQRNPPLKKSGGACETKPLEIQQKRTRTPHTPTNAEQGRVNTLARKQQQTKEASGERYPGVYHTLPSRAENRPKSKDSSSDNKGFAPEEPKSGENPSPNGVDNPNFRKDEIETSQTGVGNITTTL